jgi:hypothetical protein
MPCTNVHVHTYLPVPAFTIRCLDSVASDVGPAILVVVRSLVVFIVVIVVIVITTIIPSQPVIILEERQRLDLNPKPLLGKMLF